MDQPLLGKVLDEIGATKQQKKEFLEAFSETMLANITVAFADGLSEEQKESLKKYSSEGNLESEGLKKWMSENGVEMDEESMKKMNEVAKETYMDFAKAIIDNLDEETKKEVLLAIQK